MAEIRLDSTEEDAARREYRKFLEQCETEATSDFDKTIMTLSGGALGISLSSA